MVNRPCFRALSLVIVLALIIPGSLVAAASAATRETPGPAAPGVLPPPSPAQQPGPLAAPGPGTETAYRAEAAGATNSPAPALGTEEPPPFLSQFTATFGSYHVAVSPRNGDVYVSDRINNVILRFSMNGTFIGYWGGYGTENGQFHGVRGICVDSLGDVYAADFMTGRVQKFSPNGT